MWTYKFKYRLKSIITFATFLVCPLNLLNRALCLSKCLNILRFVLFPRNTIWRRSIVFVYFFNHCTVAVSSALCSLTVNLLLLLLIYVHCMCCLTACRARQILKVNWEIIIIVESVIYIPWATVGKSQKVLVRNGNREQKQRLLLLLFLLLVLLWKLSRSLSTLDRGTVKSNKTVIKVRAKQKPRTAHRRTFTHTHRTHAHGFVGVLVCGGCSFLVVFISFFGLCFLAFLCEVRACAKKNSSEGWPIICKLFTNA